MVVLGVELIVMPRDKIPVETAETTMFVPVIVAVNAVLELLRLPTKPI
jgi:hypothetical protein